MRLRLVRHAESRGNFELRLQGRREYPLTERGLGQAQALAERLSATPLAAVYSSPIGRAIQTAEVIAAKAGVDVAPESRLQEYDFGEAVSGLTWEEIRAKQPEVVQALRSGTSEFPRYPGDEGRAAFQERVHAAMNDITQRHAGDEDVAVITHAGPIVVFLMHVLGRAYCRPVPFVLDNASITTVEVNTNGAAFLPPMVVTGINDACHVNHLQSADRAGRGA
ncbi:MAG TPA: histidine phosphatase family protein [Dehalococcoidia bacterium]|nr:histidine phosphatase family protein [Dehalococcoidia bacterium]